MDLRAEMKLLQYQNMDVCFLNKRVLSDLDVTDTSRFNGDALKIVAMLEF